jgi:TonB family protein
MKLKTTRILFLILCLGAPALFAQTTDTPAVPKIISKGVVNGSAVVLPRPAYPPAAKAVNASGTVSVQVTIDEEGNVISANAAGGHPLLQSAAVEAAKQAKFKPTLLQGQPVKVTGIITYNFVTGGTTMSFSQIGYELSLAEKSMSFNIPTSAAIANSFPAAWTEEKEDLTKVESYLRNKVVEENKAQTIQTETSATSENKSAASSKNENVKAGETFKLGTINVKAGDRFKIGEDNTAGAVRATSVFSSKQPLDHASTETLREIQSKIENRLITDEKKLWSFRLGRVFGKMKAEIDDSAKTQINASELNQLAANAPVMLSERILAKFKEISDLSLQSGDAAGERKEKLVRLIEELRGFRVY